MQRLEMLNQFYDQLSRLNAKTGLRRLSECSSRSGWPQRGVYFFFENNELRADSSRQLKVVRVGTHAVSLGSKTTLWNRLSTHRGSSKGTGNHRGSIFRKRIGEALLSRTPNAILQETWGVGSTALGATCDRESNHEREVSSYIGAMPFLWLAVHDEPSSTSDRSYLERNAIALISNHLKPAIDPPSEQWLGHFSKTESIRNSGLWNTNYVDDSVDRDFILRLKGFVNLTK